MIVDSNGAVTSTGTLITVQEMGNGMVFITIPSLNVRVMRTNTQVTVSIDSSSSGELRREEIDSEHTLSSV